MGTVGPMRCRRCRQKKQKGWPANDGALWGGRRGTGVWQSFVWLLAEELAFREKATAYAEKIQTGREGERAISPQGEELS